MACCAARAGAAGGGGEGAGDVRVARDRRRHRPGARTAARARGAAQDGEHGAARAAAGADRRELRHATRHQLQERRLRHGAAADRRRAGQSPLHFSVGSLFNGLSNCFLLYLCLFCAQGNENYTGMAARDTADALKALAASVRGVAATTRDRELQDKLLEHSRDVMEKSANLIEEAKKAVNNPNNPDNQTRLAMVKFHTVLKLPFKSCETCKAEVVECSRDKELCVSRVCRTRPRCARGFPFGLSYDLTRGLQVLMFLELLT